jgi:hypothetical protein
MSKTREHEAMSSHVSLYYSCFVINFRLFNIKTMVKSTETDSNEAAKQQLAAQPAQIPTHPDEEKNLPPPNLIPDGVSPPIQHPLDPLNAGKN